MPCVSIRWRAIEAGMVTSMSGTEEGGIMGLVKAGR